jgi:hypothetical protein
VRVKRAAAVLRLGDDHFESVARQNARGRPVRVRERGTHDAAGEERDATALRATRRIRRGERTRRCAIGHEVEQRREASRQRDALSDHAQDRGGAEALREHREVREWSEDRGAGQQELERHPPHQAFGERPWPRRLYLRARAFHESAELHS